MIKVLAREGDAWIIQSNLDVITVNKGDYVMCITYLGSVLTGSLYGIDYCYVRFMLDDNSFYDIKIGYINELKLTEGKNMTNFEDLRNGFSIEWKISDFFDGLKKLTATLCFRRPAKENLEEIIPIIRAENIQKGYFPEKIAVADMRNKIIEQLEEIIRDIRSINEPGL